jgi:hypothetical protein
MEKQPSICDSSSIFQRRKGRRRCREICFVLVGVLALSSFEDEFLTSAFSPTRVPSSKHTTTRRLAGYPRSVLQSSSSSSSVITGASTNLQELKDAINLVTVVESAYHLEGFVRRDSDRATACCPFHDDNNPSLLIGADRYKCFGCGASGDVFQFVQEYEKNMNFPQVIRFVREELLPLCSQEYSGGKSRRTSTSRPRPQQSATMEIRERLLAANAAATAFYADCLTRPFAGGARRYLGQRSLSPATVRAWGMGFAPNAYFNDNYNWGQGSLVEHLKHLKFTPAEIVQAGLARPTKRALERQQQQAASTSNGRLE